MDRNQVNGRQTGEARWSLALRAAAKESFALARQSLLMPRDLGACLPLHASGRRAVIVMHGLFATAGAMRVLRERIEAETGLPTGSFSYPPWWGVRELSRKLEQFLAPLSPSTAIHLVGHSLGGLTARYHVQVSPRDQRVVQTISLGSPFGGTTAFGWVPRLVPQLRPGSEVLGLIDGSWGRASHVPHTSIAATHDLLVQPWRSAAWRRGEVVVAELCGHNSLLFDPTVAACVVERIHQVACGRLRTAA
jgi:pimeloyl-ACP methyl ester carboxylesterase